MPKQWNKKTWSRPGARKVTIVLLRRHVAQLDTATVDMRLRSGKPVSRSALIRALIEAAETRDAAKR